MTKWLRSSITGALATISRLTPSMLGLRSERAIFAQGFKVDYFPYQQNESQAANAAYLQAEEQHRNKPGYDVVLVSVDSLKSLRSAYPNYFLDTKIFRELVDETMRSTTPIRGGKRTMAQQLQLL